MEEFKQYLALVDAVVNGQSATHVRREAEAQISSIHNNREMWQHLLHFLSFAIEVEVGMNTGSNDNVLFFIGQGLHTFVWRYWASTLSEEQQTFFTTSIITALTSNTAHVPAFARSKLEQVLAGICGVSCTIAPALSLVVEYGEPGFDVGFSVIRTTCEELLQDDPRILPSNRKALAAAISEVAEPLSNVVCDVCLSYIENGGNVNRDQNRGKNATLLVALQLMRVLVAKLPVGGHLSSALLQKLFQVCEIDSVNNLIPPLVDNGMSSAQIQQTVTGNSENAILAVEILTEIMSKRYIPPSTHVSLLVELAGQAVGLLQRFRSQESLESFDTSLPQLEFIRVFVESHIERAINVGTSGGSPEILGLIESFLEEFSALTQSCTEPEVLYKIILVWEGLLAFEVAKDVILANANCLQSGYHIFRTALMQNNELLAELSDEIEDDLQLDPYGDARAQTLLAHVLRKTGEGSNASRGGPQLAQEEGGSIGYALLVSVTRCVTMFAESDAFRGKLQSDAQDLLQQTLAELTGGSNSAVAALDCVYLLRLMPLFMTASNLIPHLLPLVQSMTVQRSYAQGKAYVYLFQRTCQLLETLLREYLRVLVAGSGDDSVSQAMYVDYVTGCMPIVLEATNCMVSPPPSVVMGSSVVFLLNVMSLPEEILGTLSSPAAKECHISIHQTLSEQLGAGMSELYERSSNGSLPIEVGILITCLVSQMFEVAMQTACQTWGQAIDEGLGGATWSSTALSTVIRINASLEALTRFRADSKQAAKQSLLTALFDSNVPERLGAGLSSLLQQISSGASSTALLLTAASSLVSLSHALLLNLGKKSFFDQASSVLVSSSRFIGTEAGAGAAQLLFLNQTGLELTHQILRLTQVIASSSTSSISTLGEQTDITRQLLTTISGALSDKTVCVELLEEVLECGWTCVSCYWQSARSMKSALSPGVGGLAAAIQSSRGVVGVDGPESGEGGGTVRPLVELLMQLFAACMDPGVPPHDALLSIQGPMSMHGSRHLFTLTWFRESCWSGAVSACLRVLLLRIHAAHHDSISELLQALCAGVLPAGAGVETNSSELVQFVCQQVVEISAEADSDSGGETATNILQEVLSHHPLDTDLLIGHVLDPIAAFLSRSQQKTDEA